MRWGSNEEAEKWDSHAEIQILEKKLGKPFPWYERVEMPVGWANGPEMKAWWERRVKMGREQGVR
jgi:hypothetical protein